MSNNIYKLVYCSRNQIRGTPEEIVGSIQNILRTARANNAKAGVTGALLFNEGLFAQVLEGPMSAVERIFEQIQNDPRHSDVTVLQSDLAETRDFPEWSMAFTSTAVESVPRFAMPVFEKAFSDPSSGGKDVLALLNQLVVQEDWLMA